jgi:hypothetical protein
MAEGDVSKTVDKANPFKKLSKTEKYVVLAGGLGIGGYLVYHHHSTTGSWNPFSTSSTAATTANSTGASIDPITGMAYSNDAAIDPQTGLGYLAEAQQYGTVAAAEASVSAYGQSTATGSGIPVNPASPASSGTINTPVGTSVYTSNAAWAQAATAGLVSVGYDGPTVATALGNYETQTPLSPAQLTLVNTAIAEYGPAPIGNLQLIPQPASGPGNTTPVSAPTVSGGKQLSATTSSITFQFNSNNAVKVVYNLTGPGLAASGRSATVSIGGNVTQRVESGLQKGKSYTLYVTPYNSSGTGGVQGHIDGATTGQ